MAPFFARRPTQPVVIIGQPGVEMDDPASHLDSLLGDPFTDPDAGSCGQSHHNYSYHNHNHNQISPDPDPEVDSLRPLRSDHNSHHGVAEESSAQPNKLHRRRNQYSYMNAAIPPASSTSSDHAALSSPHRSATGTRVRSQQSTGALRQTRQHDDHQFPSQSQHQYQSRPQSQPQPQSQSQPHRRVKSYTLSSGPSSWLLNNPLVEVRRQASVTGERRETRKLQKEHPTGSARPNMSVEIDGQEKGSGLGVRRKMGRLRELYRK